MSASGSFWNMGEWDTAPAAVTTSCHRTPCTPRWKATPCQHHTTHHTANTIVFSLVFSWPIAQELWPNTQELCSSICYHCAQNHFIAFAISAFLHLSVKFEGRFVSMVFVWKHTDQKCKTTADLFWFPLTWFRLSEYSKTALNFISLLTTTKQQKRKKNHKHSSRFFSTIAKLIFFFFLSLFLLSVISVILSTLLSMLKVSISVCDLFLVS